MTSQFKSYTLVIIQFACIILIAVTGPILAKDYFLLTFQLVSGLLVLWAIGVMRIGSFNISPIVKDNSRLVQSGPYKYIRHPMYTSVLLVTLMMVVNELTIVRITAWFILLIDLILKLNYEEKLLTNHFDEYKSYMKRTKRLLPFVY